MANEKRIFFASNGGVAAKIVSWYFLFTSFATKRLRYSGFPRSPCGSLKEEVHVVVVGCLDGRSSVCGVVVVVVRRGVVQALASLVMDVHEVIVVTVDAGQARIGSDTSDGEVDLVHSVARAGWLSTRDWIFGAGEPRMSRLSARPTLSVELLSRTVSSRLAFTFRASCGFPFALSTQLDLPLPCLLARLPYP